MANTYKLAELLLRRKELADKVKLAATVKAANLFETKVKRVTAAEGYDDINATVPKLTLSQVTAEFDWYSHQLRLTDAAIQQANWTTEVSTPEDVMKAYVEPAKAEPAKA